MLDFINNNLLIGNTGNDTLTVVDLISHSCIENITIDSLIRNSKNNFNFRDMPKIGIHQIINKVDSIFYSVNSYDNSIFRINLATKEIEDVVYVGSFPTHIALVNDLLFVTNSDSNSLSIIDEKKFSLIENIAVGEKPHDVKVDIKNRSIYIANSGEYRIDVISLDDKFQYTIKLDSNPLHILPNGDDIYFLSSRVNGVSKSSISLYNLECKKIIKKVNIKGVIIDMVLIDFEKSIFITNIEDGCIYQINIDEERIVNKFYVGGMPNTILWNKENLLFITDSLNNNIVIFDINKKNIVKTIKTGIEPNGMLLI